MKTEKDIVLEKALSLKCPPPVSLNESVLAEGKEKRNMRKNGKKRYMAAAVVVASIAICGGTGYAAMKYLTPEQVVKEAGRKELLDAFRGEDALFINETQSQKGYDVTLLGASKGEHLYAYSGSKVSGGSTYLILAIAKSDGTSMPDLTDTSEKDWVVSPVINGENPYEINIFSMTNGTMYFVKDGIQYYLLECDNLECFAGRGVKIAVTNAGFISPNNYVYDTDTKKTTVNEKDTCVNLLLDVPFPKDLADEEKAQAYLDQWSEGGEENEQEAEMVEDSTCVEKLLDSLRDYSYDEKIDFIREHFTRIENQVQTIYPDLDGYYSYSWEAMGTGEEVDPFTAKEKFLYGNVKITGYGADDEMIQTTILTLNKDKSILVEPYYINISDLEF